MLRLLAACIHAIFVVTGTPEEILRPNPLAMDKWETMIVSYEITILGLILNTRALTIGITDEYLKEIQELLGQFLQPQIRYFTVNQLQKLAGKLSLRMQIGNLKGSSKTFNQTL